MNGSPSLHNQLETWRIWVFAGVLLLVFALYVSRLFTLQIVEGQEWAAQARDNSQTEFNLQALRGIIYDRNGIILARNIASYNVVITAADLPGDEGAMQEIFRQLSVLIKVPVNQGELSQDDPFVPCISEHGIMQIWEYGDSSTPYTPVPVKCDVDQTTAMIVQEKSVDWPGVSLEVQPIRDYPTNSLTASIIGFLGPIPAAQEQYYRDLNLVPNRDKVGYAGLELQYEEVLAGRNGKRTVEVDVGGAVIRDVAPPIAPQPGYSLELTIDTRFQEATEAILVKEIEGWNAWLGDRRYSAGVAIGMNPQTGEILSMVSYPTYENQRMTRFIPAYYYDQLFQDPTNPLLNHAVGDVLPAGSVFKLVTAVGALNEGVVTPEQIIETPGKLVITERFFANDPGRGREYVDWVYKTNPGGFGQLDFLGGLANSSNVYFYKLGGGYEDEVPEGLGICRLGTYSEALGYGPASGLGLPDEQKGLIPNPTWKRINHAESWSTGDTYIASVGQGYVLSTPIQVLLSAAIVANDGRYMQPTLLRQILDGEGNVVQRWQTADGDIVDSPVPGSRQVSPFQPHLKWDLTRDAVIQEYGITTVRGCEPIIGQKKTVAPWVIQKVQEGMRLAVISGTLEDQFANSTIPAAGKTGTAEYCDKYAQAQNRCIPGAWPAHAWTVAYAPYENPEIAVVVYVYNGSEGSTVAGPIVQQILEAYFQIKAIDNAQAAP